MTDQIDQAALFNVEIKTENGWEDAAEYINSWCVGTMEECLRLIDECARLWPDEPGEFRVAEATEEQQIDYVVSQHQIAPGLCEWGVSGGTIRVGEADLRAACEEAFDEWMPEWPSMVEQYLLAL